MDSSTLNPPPRFGKALHGAFAIARPPSKGLQGWAGSPSEGTVFLIQMERRGDTDGLESMLFLAHACPWGIAMADLACEMSGRWSGAGGGDFWRLWEEAVATEGLCPPIKLPTRLLLAEAIERAGQSCFTTPPLS